MHPDTGRAELLAYLGGDKAVHQALITWAQGIGCRPEVPSVPWTREGRFTKAKLLAIELRRPSGEARTVIIKICAQRDGLDEGGKRAILEEDHPEFAKRFLVGQPFPGAPVGSDRYLLCSTVNGPLVKTVTLRDVGHDHLPGACRRLADILMNEWNGRSLKKVFRPSSPKMSVAAYLQRELRGALRDDVARHRIEAGGLNAEDADWIALPGEGPDRSLPNPIRMADPGGIVGDMRITCLEGESHGDAHLDNVLVRRAESGGIEANTMRLIDLVGYESRAPLSRDIATLALSIALQLSVERQSANPGYRLTKEEAEDLIRLLLNPADGEPTDLPPYISQSIKNVYNTAYAALGDETDPWRDQYLLSLQAQALTYLSYSSIDEEGWWWFFRLAARAAETFLKNRECLRSSKDPRPVGPKAQDRAAADLGPPADDPAPADRAPRSDDPPADDESTTPDAQGASTAMGESGPADAPDEDPEDPVEDAGACSADTLLAETLLPELERLMAGAARLVQGLPRFEDCRAFDQVVDGARAPRHLAETLQQSLATLPAIDLDERYSVDLRERWAKARDDATASLQSLLDRLPSDRHQAVRARKCLHGLDGEAVALRASLACLALLLLNGV